MSRALVVSVAFVAIAAHANGQSRIASARPAMPAARSPRTLSVMTAQSLANVYGRTIDATKVGIPGAHMRLRNARTGRIAAEGLTDKNGDFEFLGVEPGLYVPEMISNQARLLAAGDILVLEYGQTVATIVRLPVKLSLFNLMKDSGAMTDALEANAVSLAAETGVSVIAESGAAAAKAAALGVTTGGGTISTGIFAPTLGTIINVATSAGILTRIPQSPPATPGQ